MRLMNIMKFADLYHCSQMLEYVCEKKHTYSPPATKVTVPGAREYVEKDGK